MAKTGPVGYIRQVRAELKKITWPSRKEITISTTFVFVMVLIASVFLYVADQFFGVLVREIMKLGL